MYRIEQAALESDWSEVPIGSSSAQARIETWLTLASDPPMVKAGYRR
jgi:hypothetical protein